MMIMFTNELAFIQNDTLRTIVRRYMEEAVPEYFYHCGASSSGKFHPVFSQGEGGLVRHTKAVVMFLDELMRMSSYAYMKQDYKDYAYAAAIVHDTCKYGMGAEMDKSAYKEHDKNAATFFEAFALENGYCPSELMLGAIRAHMGQWANDPTDRPFTNIDRAVHMADYMASRSFIDIPELNEAKRIAEKG